MPIPTFIARQLAHPTGWFGRFVIRRLLNAANRKHNQLASEHLSVGRHDRVLEIGFGGGDLLSRLHITTPNARIIGLEMSKDMLRSAVRRFRVQVDAGSMRFVCGSVDALPFIEGAFNQVCSMNTIYFWPALDRGLHEISRVVVGPGGMLLGFGSDIEMRKAGFAARGFSLYSASAISDAMRRCGVSPGRIESCDVPGGKAFVLSGDKSSVAQG